MSLENNDLFAIFESLNWIMKIICHKNVTEGTEEYTTESELIPLKILFHL